MAPGTLVSPPRMTTGSAFSASVRQRELHAQLAAQIMPATSATKPATHQTMTQMRLSGMPIDLRGLVVVGHGAQRAAGGRLLEEQASARPPARPRSAAA
jgi:hypothetical protein